jgi:glycosyltransferase involved in cell wall biosynthesis
MRIGIDATCWTNDRGYGRHARALLRALVRLDQVNEFTFFVDADNPREPLPERARVVRIATARPAAVAASADGRRSLGDMLLTSRTLSREPLDILLFPSIYSFAPAFTTARKLVFIHDVIAETYPHLTVPNFSARIAWKAKVALGRAQADGLITVSEYSRGAISRHFRMSADDIFVVGEASDPVFRRLDAARLPDCLRSAAGRPMLVYVGGFGPHKNLEVLLRSFAEIQATPQFRSAMLVLAGEYRKEVFHSYYTTLRSFVEQLNLADSVIFPGYVPDEELVHILNLAQALVLPSLMEGFGLPAVEAAACGCPVIATTNSPLPSLLGRGGIYVDPARPDDITGAIERVLASPELRREMSAAGVDAARRLTWDAAAQQLIAVIHKVVGRAN